MTCIVGMLDKGCVILGGDSAGVAGFNLTVRADQKVFLSRDGELAMGFTTSFRMGQLLRYKFQRPQHIEGVDCFEYMATAFVDSVRACLKDGGFATKDKDQENGGTFLVGYHGRLFCIESDYQVEETTCGYNAVGCGSAIALGSLFSSTGKSVEARAAHALKAAQQWNAGVREPFHFVATKKHSALGAK